MKKNYAIISMLALAIGVQSQVLVYEGFNYAVGDLGTNGGWVPRSTGTDIQVVADNLSYSGFIPSVGNAAQYSSTGKDPQLAFSTQTSGVVYASFLLKVTDVSIVTVPRYSFGLSNSADPATSSGNYTACLYIKPSTGGYQIGVNRGTTDTDTQWAGAEYAQGDVVLVVVSYDITNQISKLWVNPLASSFGTETPPAESAIASAGNFPGSNSNTVSSVFFRQTNTQNPIMVLDELRIGTSWADVTSVITTTNDVINNNSLKLSTNLLTNEVHVVGGSDNSKVDFYSIDSKLVKSVSVSGNSNISVIDLPKGLYVVTLSSGSLTNTLKVVKH